MKAVLGDALPAGDEHVGILKTALVSRDSI